MLIQPKECNAPVGAVSRRTLLSAAAGTLVLPLLPRIARARSLELGGAELTVVSDGHMTLPIGFVLPDVPRAELDAFLAAHGLPVNEITPDCNITILRSGDRLVVFDAGAGSNFMSTAGRLAENLTEAGIDPADVTDVVFTHGHPDHLWGVVDDFEELLFPEATFRMAAAEWDYWRAPGTLDATPEERKTFVVGAQNRLTAIEDRVELFQPGDEVVPGVEAMDTAGHTPGHISLVVHGSGDPVIVTGDALSHAAVSFERPSWRYGADQDPDAGIDTRLRLLDRIAAENLRIVGFHLPYPGVGRAEKDGLAYRFVAES